jgi:hypothetical protein
MAKKKEVRDVVDNTVTDIQISEILDLVHETVKRSSRVSREKLLQTLKIKGPALRNMPKEYLSRCLYVSFPRTRYKWIDLKRKGNMFALSTNGSSSFTFRHQNSA